jgi:putative hydrolase of the HAD superfamily
MLKLVAFDFDDTLYSENLYVQGGLYAVASYIGHAFQINHNLIYKQLLIEKNKNPRGKIFSEVLSKYSFYNSSITKDLIREYRSQTLFIALYPGVKKLLDSLKKKYVLALITDGLTVVQMRKIKHLKIDAYFNYIYCTQDEGVRKGKPDTKFFQKMLNDAYILPQEAIYIGNDPQKDFLGPKKLGIRTIRVLQGRYRGEEAICGAEPTFTIQKIKNVEKLLNNIK